MRLVRTFTATLPGPAVLVRVDLPGEAPGLGSVSCVRAGPTLRGRDRQVS